MNVKTEFRCILVAAFLLLSCFAYADDGSWSSSFSISGGEIYSPVDDSRIVLEKELLLFTGSSTEAYFLFRNTSGRDVELDCGFPVIHRIEAYLNGDYAEIPAARYGAGEIPGLGFFKTEIRKSEDEDGFSWVRPEVIPDTRENNSREFIGPEIPAAVGIDFEIFQDDRRIEVDDILLERSVGSESAALSFHFRHKLSFPASGTSIVKVKYTQDLLAGNDGGAACDVFKWNYVIGTGGTWKGPIGELFFIKPAGWEGELHGLSYLSVNEGVEIYHAENYEPDREASFSLVCRPVSIMEEYTFSSEISELRDMWTSALTEMPLPSVPAQEIIRDVEASSALTDNLTVFLENGVIAEAGFSAVSAFDGFEETSWCEAVTGSGEGEYLEAELAEGAAGIIIRNGFKRMPLDDWVYDIGMFEDYVKDDKAGFRDYFSMNGRVKILDVVDVGGNTVERLELEDSRDPQVFYGMDLAPGRYRFVIRDVYSGTRWEDTCIAEIGVVPKDDGELVGRLYTDDFYRSVFGIRRYR